MLHRLMRRLRALARRDAIEHELDEEIRLHIDMETEDLVRSRGLAPAAARRQAILAFGGVERAKESHRDARGTRWLEELAQDLRFSVRTLRRTPSFTVTAALVLALGIGASTAVFSLANAALLAPLPFPHEERLVRIYESNSPANRWGLSVADVRGIEQWQRTLAAVGTLSPREVAVVTSQGVTRQLADYATSGFFRALGVRPLAGRLFATADDAVGAPAVAIVTHAFAARELGGDAAAVGRAVTIDGRVHVVVGVVPSLSPMNAELWPVLQLETPKRRGPFGLVVVGRLADGVTPDAARRDLAAVSARLLPEWAQSFQDSTAKLTPVPLRKALLGDAGRTLGVLGGAVALVLLIAVANVASLMLVRATARWREVSLRSVLGATKLRLVRLLVTESVVLAATGAALGLALGALGLRTYAAIGPRLPRMAQAQLDWRAALVAGGLAVVAGAVIGAYPALLLLKGEVAAGLHGGEREVGGGRRAHAMRGAFVVAEFALALPLLAGAGLLVNSFLRLQRVEPGFDPARLLSVRVALPGARYATDSAVAGFWARALPRVLEVPGVTGAALGDALPPDAREAGLDENNFDLVDRPVRPGTAQPTSPWIAVSVDYLDVLGAPLLQGRAFARGDTVTDTTRGTPLLVSRSWAKHYFPDGSAVGRRLISGGCVTCPPDVVVGVVGDVKYMGLGGTGDAVYEPVPLGFQREANLFVRTSAPPAEVVAHVVDALRSVDPGVPLEDAAPMAERVYASVAQPRHVASLLGAFAIAAIVLAAVGIFGMLSYTVSARRREIGVRMALGARPGAVTAMIVRRGMTHALAGALVGLAIALAATRWLAGLLYAVGASDPATLVATTALLLAVALIACWLPARRAAGIDPVRAIRSE